MKSKISNILIGSVLVLILLSMSMFVVNQGQTAIVFQLGQMMRVESTPGLKWKIPLVQNVSYFDARNLTVDSSDPELFITAEKKNLLVDYFVKWRIQDVKQYYISVGGDEMRARIRLMQTVNSVMRAEIGKSTIHDVVSGEREQIMDVLREATDADARKIGVQVLDVRLKTVDFPPEISDSVYRRMDAERKRVANELRASGAADGEKIKADADRQRQVILAQAYRDAQKTKGEGDAKATEIYAAAFGHNPEFYAFYRSLEAYKKSFDNKSDVMVLDPNSAFFKYLQGPGKLGK